MWNVRVGLLVAAAISHGCGASGVAMTTPQGAHVVMDGVPVGTTPAEVELSPPREVLIFLPGFAPVITGQGTRNITLRPIGYLAPPLHRAEAWQKVRAAVEAARASDCASVASLGTEIRALDPTLHVNVFTRELTIATCTGVMSGGVP